MKIYIKYNMKQTGIDRVRSIKDLGITFDTKLSFDEHIDSKVNKAYSILGIGKRKKYHSSESFVLIYKLTHCS